MNLNELYDATRSGEKSAENRLFDALRVRFHYFASQRVWIEEDIDDIVQDAVMTVAREYSQIVFEKSFSAWAYNVMNNVIRNYVRKKRTRSAVTGPDVEDFDTFASWSPDPVLESQLIACLRELCQVNSRYARTLNLKYQGFSAEEICDKLKVTANHFYVILSRARSMLKACLEKGGIK